MNDKVLIIMRHGQAHEPFSSQPDITRELTSKGQSDCYKAGQFIAQSGFIPQRILCSSATRTVSTAEIVASQIGYDKEAIIVEQMLYQASLGTLITFIHELPNSCHVAMIIGHNPTLTYLVEYLTNQSIIMQPASCCFLRFAIANWNLVSKGTASVLWEKHSW